MSTFLELHLSKYGQDWQKSGYWSNAGLGIRQAPDIGLLPFVFYATKTLTVSTFQVRKIITGYKGAKLIEHTLSLTAGWITKTTGTFNSMFSYDGSQDIDNVGLEAGVWEYYVTMSDSSIYISEPMNYPGANDVITTLGDFDDDFNNDFNI